MLAGRTRHRHVGVLTVDGVDSRGQRWRARHDLRSGHAAVESGDRSFVVLLKVPVGPGWGRGLGLAVRQAGMVLALVVSGAHALSS